MGRLFLSLLFWAGVAAAQPLIGPFEVLHTDTAANIINPHVTYSGINDCIAVAVWQFGGDMWHESVFYDSGAIFSPPTPDYPPDGFEREVIGTAAAEYDSSEGWVALVLDRNSFEYFVIARFSRNDIGIYSDEVMRGYQSTGSYSYAFGMSSGANHSFLVCWQNQWSWWNGQFSCGNEGPMYSRFDNHGSSHWPWHEPYGGGVYSDAPSSAICELQNDSVAILVAGDGGSSIILTAPDSIIDGQPLLEGSLPCAMHMIEFLVTRGGTGLVLSNSGSSGGFYEPRLIMLPNLGSCEEIIALDDDPIASCSDPDYGIAWLAKYGAGLVLYRADTTGTLIYPAGAIHWPEAGYEIVEAALAMNDEGLLTALWSEREPGGEHTTILRMASVGWNTYLAAEPSSFVPHPSSFELSAYPNPFNGTLRVQYDLPRAQSITLSVFNVLGQQVALLTSGMMEAGAHEAIWSPEVAGGIYFVSLQTVQQTKTTKVLYLK